MCADSKSEPEIVTVARAVLAGSRDPVEVDRAFAQATVFGVRPERPGVLVSQVPGKGRWALVFTTLTRLMTYAGEADYFETTGADLLKQLPSGVGVLVDPLDVHGLPIVSHLVEPGVLQRMRDAHMGRTHQAG